MHPKKSLKILVRIRIRTRQSEVPIRGSGSVPKCHGTGTLPSTNITVKSPKSAMGLIQCTVPMQRNYCMLLWNKVPTVMQGVVPISAHVQAAVLHDGGVVAPGGFGQVHHLIQPRLRQYSPINQSHQKSHIRRAKIPAESIATLPPFGPIEGHKWFFQISSQ